MVSYGPPKTDIVIDIETVVNPVTSEEFTKFMEEYEPPANYKTPEAISRHKDKTEKEAGQKILDDKRFSIGGKRMISCALGIADTIHREVRDIISWASDDTDIIAQGVVKYLNQFPAYRLIGWNHTGFDLPEVIKALTKAGIRPKSKAAKWDIIDLCNHPFRRMKMKDVAQALGLELMDISAEDIGRLHAEGDWKKIQAYNEHDIFLTGMIFLAADTLFTF